MIAKCPNSPKDSEKRRKSERSNEKGNCACNNSDDENDLKVYASMALMSSDDKGENKDYGNRKNRKIVLLVLHLTKNQIIQIVNALDADLKII